MKLTDLGTILAQPKSASASAAASAPARARPADAASRARRLARASPSKASKAARCRCIVACRSAASGTFRASHLNEVNLGRLQQAVDAGKLDAEQAGDDRGAGRGGRLPATLDGVKVLGVGELKAKLALEVFGASKSAVAAIEKAGGSVKILAPVGSRVIRPHIGDEGKAGRRILPQRPVFIVLTRERDRAEGHMASAAEQLAANLNFGALRQGRRN